MQSAGGEQALKTFDDLAKTAAGVIVPAAVADKSGRARDMDGRRRLVYTKDERRKIDHVHQLYAQHGVGWLIGCVGAFGPKVPGTERSGKGNGFHHDGSKACGEPMQREGIGTDDFGWGCKCTRIHFQRT